MGVYLIRNSAKEFILIILVAADVILLARALHKILSVINMQTLFDLQHLPCCWNTDECGCAVSVHAGISPTF
jgi:hypothetical protein